MSIDMNTVRLLGAAQLIVIVGGLITERLLASAVGSGSISEMLVNISENLNRMRISNLAALAIQSTAIVVMGVLYYFVFSQEYKIIALVALGFFLVAAITLAVSKIGAYALIPLSQEFVEAGAPEPSYFQKLGNFFYYGFDRQGWDIQMLFMALGLLLVQYLFYISGYIPRALSIWGLAAICLLLIPTLLQLYDRDFLPAAQILAIPYAPY
ncbi:MAG: DUF4386 domain-containing protein [Anaerolineales bacterium]|nr:DUF4386 domain-containing protein [Anaerolineales bacterium]